MGTNIIWMGAAVFTYLCSSKKSFNLSNTKRCLDVMLRSLDGCKLEQFEGSRHRVRSGWMMLGQLSVRAEYHVVRTDARDPISLT